MKGPYIAPELTVTCFAPVERLAAEESVLNFGDLLAASGSQKPAGKSEGDLIVILP